MVAAGVAVATEAGKEAEVAVGAVTDNLGVAHDQAEGPAELAAQPESVEQLPAERGVVVSRAAAR